MKAYRRSGSAALLAVAASVLLAACGGAGPSKHAKDYSSVKVAFSAKVATLDPDLAVGASDVSVINLIGGRLYEVNPDGQVVPSLASKSSVSEDKLTWTFDLKPNLKFSDGSELTAEDVVATFERALADKANVQGALYSPIKGVSASQGQIVFQLRQPYPDLTSMLAEEFAAVLPAARLNDPKFFDRPISAGPYRVESRSGSSLVLKRNKNFHGPRPKVETLTLVTVADANTRIAQLRSGQVDFAPDLPPSAIDTLRSVNGVKVSVVKGYGWYSLNMATGQQPLDDVNLRKAISLAIDRDKIAKLIWNGRNDAMSGFWPSTMEGHVRSRTSPDLEQAKNLVKQARCYPDCNVGLIYPPDVLPFGDQLSLLVKQDLERAGIEVSIQKTEFATFNSKIGSGKYQLALYGLYDFVNTPIGLLTYALSVDGGISANFSGFTSPEMSDAVERTLRSDGSARAAALGDVETEFASSQPFATLATWAYTPGSRVPASVIRLDPSGLIRVGETS